MPIIHKTPIPPPPKTGIKRVPLSAEEQTKLDIVLKHFSDPSYVVPIAADHKASLSVEERFWLTKECLLRYLRGSKWSETVAIKRLEDTLKWRHEFGFYNGEMSPEGVEPESLTGKELIFGYDVEGRPACYMLPSRQNTDGSTTEGQRRQLQFAIFMMERSFDLMGPGVENVALMIDFSDRGKNPSLSTARYMLSYLQNHYPERLGRALVANLPFVVTLFFKAVSPFIDPVTREKIKFNPSVVPDGLFEASQVTTAWGGEVEIPFEHRVYWPALMKMCAERRAAQLEKWQSLGGTVGISEWDIREDVMDEKEQLASATTAKAEEPVAPAQAPEIVA